MRSAAEVVAPVEVELASAAAIDVDIKEFAAVGAEIACRLGLVLGVVLMGCLQADCSSS